MQLQRIKILFLSMMLCTTISSFAQNSMGVGTTTPNPNAVLELVSPTNNQGLLVPRVTTAQRTSTTFTSNLSAVDNGLMVFDTDEGRFYFWFGASWNTIRNLAAGDMSTATYDTDLDGKPDSAQYAQVAGSLDGFTIESSVPAGAVFTDAQSAAGVPFTPAGNITATDVQAALEEIDANLLALGTGDMLRATYDADLNSIVDNAELVNGLTLETAVPAGAVFTDAQTLATNTTPGNISISDGNAITLNVDDADASSTNELQTISKVGSTVTLSNGGGSFTDATGPTGTSSAEIYLHSEFNLYDFVGVAEPTVTIGNTNGYAFKSLAIVEQESGSLAVPLDLPRGAVITGYRLVTEAVGTANWEILEYPIGADAIVGGAPPQSPLGGPQALLEGILEVNEAADITTDTDNFIYLLKLTAEGPGSEVRIYQAQVVYQYSF